MKLITILYSHFFVDGLLLKLIVSFALVDLLNLSEKLAVVT